MIKYLRKVTSLLLIFVMVAAFMVPFTKVANAAALTSKSDTMTNLSDSTDPAFALSDHAIQFTTPTGVATGQTIVVTMPSDFDGATGDAQGALDFSDVDLLEDTTPDGVCDGVAETLVASSASSSQWNTV